MIKDAIDQTNTEHYSWGASCDGWHFLKTNSLSIIKERMPAGTSERLHYHEKAQQFFYILSGTATFHISGELIPAKAHQGIHIKPGVQHKISNQSDSDLEFLVISEPHSHGDRVNLKK